MIRRIKKLRKELNLVRKRVIGAVKATDPLQRGRCSRLEIFSSIVIRFIEAFIMIWILIVIVEKINKIMLENKAKYILIVKLATVGTAITLLLDMM